MRRLFAVAAVVVLAACGTTRDASSTSGPTQASVAGTYTLKTVNGNPLPFVTQQDANVTAKMTSAQFTFASGGTWTQTQHYQTTINGTTSSDTFDESGTFTVSGTTVTLKITSAANGGPQTFSMTSDEAGNTLTLTESGYTFVYAK